MSLNEICRRSFLSITRQFTAIVCAALLLSGNALQAAPQDSATPAQQSSATLPPDQIDSLVAPIALYPDPLLSQALVASTYPLELVQLQQWLAQHKDLKDKALAGAVKKQAWDTQKRMRSLVRLGSKEEPGNTPAQRRVGRDYGRKPRRRMPATPRMPDPSNRKLAGSGVEVPRIKNPSP